MQSIIPSVIAWLTLCVLASPQEKPRELRGDGHLLGETAEQFFSEGFLGDILRACEARDWKAVNQLSNHVVHASKSDAKDYCANTKLARQEATSGIRLEYAGRGDGEAMRADIFTFEAGHLVRINMVYSAPAANVEGYHPKSYSELFEGLHEAYGPPSKSYSEPMLSAYGVKYEAHRALWMGNADVISIIEQPREAGRTEIIAETLAEYNRAAQEPKIANPLR
jgi:hypothetical protein